MSTANAALSPRPAARARPVSSSMPAGYDSRPTGTTGGNFHGVPAHLHDMQCDRLREAISARIDSEDPGLREGAVDAHLGVCAGCRAWQHWAHVVTRRTRLGGLFLDHDLTPRVIAAAPVAATRRGRRFIQQAGPAAMAAVQLSVAIPLLLLGHELSADRAALPDGHGHGGTSAGGGSAEEVA